MIPLVAQITIFNTATFWATLLGWCFLRETISLFEAIAMVVSFGGVCIIATSKQIMVESSASIIEDEDNVSGAIILGSGLMFVTAWAYASVSILTR